ncbi:hypothetical protein QTP70_035254 [Hemibagrus guttatus]|uniref:Uncharacterized protein n=1 Tax=Hemibagrus guttatus TaxID=175788 RepID=A0AAE0V5M4_9TELE|nr:hypothetical protein QTP70_035254 [Hemibagrus guttatus]
MACRETNTMLSRYISTAIRLDNLRRQQQVHPLSHSEVWHRPEVHKPGEEYPEPMQLGRFHLSERASAPSLISLLNRNLFFHPLLPLPPSSGIWWRRSSKKIRRNLQPRHAHRPRCSSLPRYVLEYYSGCMNPSAQITQVSTEIFGGPLYGRMWRGISSRVLCPVSYQSLASGGIN